MTDQDRNVPVRWFEEVWNGGRRAAIAELLVRHARAGRRVVRLKSGDPFLFGRGAEEAQVLRAHGIAYEVVPGVTSAIAVPAA